MKRTLLLLLAIASPAHAQFSLQPADGIVPVVGSTRGAFGANFKTELQLHNADSTTATGWLVFQPQGGVKRYELAPHATLSFADVVAEMGASGLGSLDVLVDKGELPTVVTRAYDDQPTGTTGVSVPLVRPLEFLASGDIRVLIVPRDLTRYRFNIGVRTLESGATLELTVRDSSGTQRHFRSVAFAANAFLQQPADLFAGIALNASDAIEVRIDAGSAVVYATTVDNQTNDSALQVLKK